MSDRGSFVTEYLYCQACFFAIHKALVFEEGLRARQVGDGPIVAGYPRSTYPGGELVYFEIELLPKLEKVICHPVRIAVLAEQGERIFIVTPDPPRPA